MGLENEINEGVAARAYRILLFDLKEWRASISGLDLRF